MSARGARGTSTGPGSTRMEELAHLYRKIADMQSELAETEARLEKAVRESAGADEMVGQMLARMGEVEGRLHAAQKQLADAEARAAAAEARASELAAQLGKSRGTQGEMGERLRAAESRLNGDRREFDRLRAELEAARTEATVAIAAAEEAQDSVIKERDQVHSLRSELARESAQRQREREERESLRMRVAELALVCDERDKALMREEMLESDLEAVRRELVETKLRASSGEHRLGGQIADQSHRIEELDAQITDARAKQSWVEKELAATRRELAAVREELEHERAGRDAAEARALDAEKTGDRARDASEAERRARAAMDEHLHDALQEIDSIAKAKAEAERRAEDAEQRLAAAREEAQQAALEVQSDHALALAAARAERDVIIAERDAVRMRLDNLEIERELHDGIDARTKRAHETEIAALHAAHVAEVDRLHASIEEATQAAAKSHYEALTNREQLTIARRERDAAIADRDAATTGWIALEEDVQRLRSELLAAETRAKEAPAKLRGAIADLTRMLADLEKREADVAQGRAAALRAARDLLDQAERAQGNGGAMPREEPASMMGPQAAPYPGLAEPADEEPTQIYVAPPISRAEPRASDQGTTGDGAQSGPIAKDQRTIASEPATKS